MSDMIVYSRHCQNTWYWGDNQVQNNMEFRSKLEYDGFEVYSNSLTTQNKSRFILAKREHEKYMIIEGEMKKFFSGEELNGYYICPLSVENSLALRKIIRHLNPSPIKTKGISFGMGDRLGYATSGHLELIDSNFVQPVPAQQSIRELELTGRTFREVLASAVWGAFQVGYKGSFAADGDHLKKAREVKDALDAGYSMITLDCSEKICNSIYSMSIEQQRELYQNLPDERRAQLELRYLNKQTPVGVFGEKDFLESILIYQEAISFIDEIFWTFLFDKEDVSFEISIDETANPTTPLGHYFVASELVKYNGIRVASIAPRFVGKFQKGVDYVGDISEFIVQLKLHQKVAKEWGYKISFHSASDKFSIFPYLSELTEGSFHIKTSGTSWLECIHLIAIKDPDLLREIYDFCIDHLEEARLHYDVDVTKESCPNIYEIASNDFSEILNNPSVRQLFHINYGNILKESESKSTNLREKIFELLDLYEEEYTNLIETHFYNHFKSIGIPIKQRNTPK